MVTLREEYSKHKVEKNEALNEAAIGWVMDNVLVLNESFNRDSLQRLQQSISKFDSTFAPYAARVPEIRACLDGAVDLMNSLTMGKNVTKKDRRLQLAKEEKEALKDPATYAVKYMSILYNTLSRFFNKDMRVVLGFPIFKVAVENPQTPLMDLADKDKMKAVLMHAMVPSREIQPILHRMYRSMDLPSIDYGKIADELLTLSVNDFHDLMQIDKVPLVVSPEREAEVATSPNPKDLEEELLTEIGEVNPEQLKKITQGITRIMGITKVVPELRNMNRALQDLQSKALATATNGGMTGGINSKMIVGTANMVYSFFDKLGELWPQIQPLIPADRNMTEAELSDFENFLKKSQGGIMAKAVNWFKGFTALPGLTPTEISTEIMNVVRAGQADPTKAIKANESLSNLFMALNSLKLPPAMSPQGSPVVPQASTPAGSQPASGASASAGPGTAVPAAPAGSAAASQSNAQGRQTIPGQAPTAPDPKTLATSMASVMGVPLSPTLEQQVGKLIGAGWKITPP